jgi:hypothetical protein
MSSAHFAQLAAALIGAATPWIVARIAFSVAARHARSVQMSISRPSVMTTLDKLTIVAVAVASVLALMLPAPSIWMGAFDLALFAVLAAVGLRALGAIDDISRPAREAGAPVREASLRPRLWVPVMFALAAPVFTWLYEVWMRDLVSGGHVVGGDVELNRRRRIRQVFAVEAALAIVCLSIAHALLDLNWVQDAAWATGLSLAGAVVGVVGCALAVSSELARRRYETA